MRTISSELFKESADTIGENPLWDADEQLFYWIDCVGRTIKRCALDGRRFQTWRATRPIGSLAKRRGGGFIAAFRNGMATLELGEDETARESNFSCAPIDFAKERLNDGKCDRAGRFWVGSMDPKLSSPAGSLFRVSATYRVDRMDDGLILANGMSWSPDNRTMYHCDSRGQHIRAYDYNLASGTLSNRRIFLEYAANAGRPDGCTIDVDGCLWVAEVHAGRVARYTPAGQLDSIIPVPVSTPTSVIFGGPGLDTLFITSHRSGFTAQQLTSEPLAGSVFVARPSVSGFAEVAFAG